MNRREETNKRYRHIFDELGIQGFEFVEYTGNHKVLFKCLRCGLTFERCNDLFKGKVKNIRCDCGNGTKPYSDNVNEVLRFYENGHSLKETTETFKVSVTDLKNWVKKRSLTNGRLPNADRIADSEKRARQYAKGMGLTIIGVWRGVDYEYPMIDNKTGQIEFMSGRILFPHKISNREIKERHVVVVDDDITIHKLIQRDGRCCYICGIETDFRDKRWGRYGPGFPTIDHVKPIKLGGTHSWDNVRVCCGRCNVKKGARYEENKQ